VRPRQHQSISQSPIKHSPRRVGATIGTGGGTLIGAVFSHVARGFGLGLAGSAVYIVARKGKDLDLPAQTGMLVRMDNTITVPVASATSASLTSSTP